MNAPVDFMQVHRQSIVIDATCPLLEKPEYIEWYRQGGATVIAPTIGGWENARTTLDRLAQ